MNESYYGSQNDSIMDSGEGGEVGGGEEGVPHNPWLDISCYDMAVIGEYGANNFYYFPPQLLLGLFYQHHNYVLKFYVSPLIALFGILLNVTFLFVVARVREMKTITNFYLGNLAVSDIMFLIFSAIDLLRTWQSNPGLLLHHPYNTIAQCVSQSLLVNLTFYGSVCMVTLVTFERYMAICHPLKHRMIGGKRYTVKVTVIAWLAAIAMGSLSSMTTVKSRSVCTLWPPGLKEILKYHIGDVQTVCSPVGFSHTSLSWFTVTYGIQTSFFILNLCVNIVFYLFIILRLGKRNVARKETRERHNDVQSVRNQVAKMLIINGTLFFMLMLPYEIRTFAEFVEDVTEGKVELLSNNQILNLEFYGSCLRFINSSMNPLIYGLSNPRYRKAYRKAFGCGLKGSKRHDNVTKKTTVSTVSTAADEHSNKL
ncbi:growth hormone secretagogue receptor type 1-like [Amphiura filiformis]|uniref:growth hormone secretagogue receptor type 1-like n=1 Tax=Amphiura filiformis TaxID=82378 RepID=UPI003B2224E7